MLVHFLLLGYWISHLLRKYFMDNIVSQCKLFVWKFNVDRAVSINNSSKSDYNNLHILKRDNSERWKKILQNSIFITIYPDLNRSFYVEVFYRLSSSKVDKNLNMRVTISETQVSLNNYNL